MSDRIGFSATLIFRKLISTDGAGSLVRVRVLNTRKTSQVTKSHTREARSPPPHEKQQRRSIENQKLSSHAKNETNRPTNDET